MRSERASRLRVIPKLPHWKLQRSDNSRRNNWVRFEWRRVSWKKTLIPLQTFDNGFVIVRYGFIDFGLTLARNGITGRGCTGEIKRTGRKIHRSQSTGGRRLRESIATTGSLARKIEKGQRVLSSFGAKASLNSPIGEQTNSSKRALRLSRQSPRLSMPVIVPSDKPAPYLPLLFPFFIAVQRWILDVSEGSSESHRRRFRWPFLPANRGRNALILFSTTKQSSLCNLRFT